MGFPSGSRGFLSFCAVSSTCCIIFLSIGNSYQLTNLSWKMLKCILLVRDQSLGRVLPRNLCLIPQTKRRSTFGHIIVQLSFYSAIVCPHPCCCSFYIPRSLQKQGSWWLVHIFQRYSCCFLCHDVMRSKLRVKYPFGWLSGNLQQWSILGVIYCVGTWGYTWLWQARGLSPWPSYLCQTRRQGRVLF